MTTLHTSSASTSVSFDRDACPLLVEQPVRPVKTVRGSLSKAVGAVSKYTPFRGKTKDLPALIEAIRMRTLKLVPGSEKMKGVVEYLGRISALNALSLSSDDTAEDVQEYSRQIEVLLVFISQHGRALEVAGLDVAAIREKLLTAQHNIAMHCIQLLTQASGVQTLPKARKAAVDGDAEAEAADGDAAVEGADHDAAVDGDAEAEAADGDAEVDDDAEAEGADGDADEARVQLNPEEERMLCDILIRSRQVFDGSDRDELVEVSESLAGVVTANPRLRKPLSDVQSYVTGKITCAERLKDARDSKATLKALKNLLESDNRDVRFEHGSFTTKARGWFRSFLERFFGWQGRSSESKEAASLIICHLQKISNGLSSDEESGEKSNRFFDHYLVPLCTSRWFQETLKHNPDLRRKFGNVFDATLAQILPNVTAESSARSELQVCAQIEGKLTAFKKYAAAHGSPETKAAIEAQLQQIFQRQKAILEREFAEYETRPQEINATPYGVRYLSDLRDRVNAKFADLSQWVTPQIAEASNVAAIREQFDARIAALQRVLAAETSLLKGDSYAVQAQDRGTPSVRIRDGFDAFMEDLETVHTHLDEAGNARRPYPEDPRMAADICNMLDGLQRNAGRFGAEIGPDNLQRFTELVDRFHALRDRLAAPSAPPTPTPDVFEQTADKPDDL